MGELVEGLLGGGQKFVTIVRGEVGVARAQVSGRRSEQASSD